MRVTEDTDGGNWVIFANYRGEDCFVVSKNQRSFNAISIIIFIFRLSDVTTLKKEGKPNQAVAKLNRALFLQPDNPVIFRERAEVYIMLSDFHGAIINLKRTIMLREEDKEAVILRLGQVYYQYGVSLASENKYVNAMEMFTEAKLHDPANKKTISRM